MKIFTTKFIVCAALLIGCLLPVAAQAKDDHSGIVGQIEELPGPWHIHIVEANGRFVADIQADDSGSFVVDLKPGAYILTPYFPSIDGTGTLVGASTPVTVDKKAFTTAELPIVNGPI